MFVINNTILYLILQQSAEDNRCGGTTSKSTTSAAGEYVQDMPIDLSQKVRVRNYIGCCNIENMIESFIKNEKVLPKQCSYFQF